MKKVILAFWVFALFSGETYAQISDLISDSSDVNLDEITVVARRQFTKIKDGAVVTKISGSPIAKLSDIQHVLNVIPGVVSQNESIKILGKGEPLIYINNRKIKDLSEVYMLSPDNIKNVELITNPGAKYDSEVKAVLKINTLKPCGEGFSADNKLSFGYQYKPYYSDNLKVNYRKENLDLFAAVNFGETKSKENVVSTDETFLSSYYNLFTDDYNYSLRKPFSSKIGMNYVFKSGNSVGFNYSNKLQTSDIESFTFTNLRQDGSLTENLNSNNNGSKKSGYHQINVYNSGSFLSWDYETDFDVMYNFSDYNHLINEVSDAGKTIVLDCGEKNDAALYAFKLEFYKEILSGGITIGTENSFVNRKGICEYLQNADNNSDSRVKESNSAFYGEFNQDFDNWSFTLGLRYENVKSDYFEYEIRQKEYCRKYQNLFPSVSVDFALGETNFSVSYDRNIQRPYYEQLGNNIGFINRYSYETGNPLLKPAYFDDFCVNFVYKDLTLTADYLINHDYIYEAYSGYGGNEQVSLLKHENYDKFHNFQTAVSYNPAFGFYRPNLYAGLFWQDMSIDFCGEKKTFDKPLGVFRFGNLLELPGKTTLHLDLNFLTSGDDELGRVDRTFSVNFEVSKILRNWTVSFLCDDVFKTENHCFNFYGNIRKCTVEKLSDTRKIEIALRYKFNPAKSKYKGTGAGNKEKWRLS
ncbi:MAG: outer membrane beta-barrel protein [Bacteroidales bacterium]|nr:outer membrane beta-barrel protein [Bacteroidales bacterium]